MSFCRGFILGLLFLAQVPASAAPAAPLHLRSFADLQKLISDRGIRSVDSLIAALPDEMRSQFTMMYKSSSVQYADPDNPRVILFGPDAKLILAFSCDPLDCVNREEIFASDKLKSRLMRAAFQNVEVIEWKAATRTFELRELAFQDPGSPAEASDPNPRLCLQCHRSDPRPNWEHYSLWPGAYGGGDDFRATVLKGQSANLADDAFYLPDESKDALKRFIDSHLSRRRYRHLLGVAEGYKIVKRDYSITSAFRRNRTFTQRVAQLNFARIARLAEESGKFAPAPALALATLAGDGHDLPAGAFPNGHVPEGLQACFKDFDALPETLRRRAEIPQPISGNYSGRSAFALVAESLGIPVTDWFMNFRRGPHDSFTTPEYTSKELARALLASKTWSRYSGVSAAAASERELEPLAKAGTLDALFGSCQPPSFFTRPRPTPRQTAWQCASCHARRGPIPVPPIPFDNPSRITETQFEAIRQVISEEATRNGYLRMPLGGDFLNMEEQAAFLDYLREKAQ